jgi:hypothetical protein
VTTTSQPAESAQDTKALDAVRLLEMSPAELNALFATSPPGQVPVGRGRGTVIVFPGTEVSKPAARVLHAVAWRGKVFDPAGQDLKNLLSPLSVPAIRAVVYTEDSWVDQRPCIVLDYSRTSTVAGWIRDEIREVAPGLYLGVVWGVGRVFDGRRRVLRFALTFPPAG